MTVESFGKQSITADAALRVIQASTVKAAEMGHPFVIAIVDESGVAKASLRMDGAALISVQIAQDKAYTAVGFGLSTDGWYDFIKDDEPLRLSATTSFDRLVPIGGGYPITQEGAVIGGIGVSGGHYSQDMEVAQAGLAALSSD